MSNLYCNWIFFRHEVGACDSFNVFLKVEVNAIVPFIGRTRRDEARSLCYLQVLSCDHAKKVFHGFLTPNT